MTKKNNNVYDEDSILVIEDDIEKVRTSLTMYTNYGNRGFLHLIREVLNNSADEASGGHATHIKVGYNRNTKKSYISDNGRGIPIGKMEVVFTVLHKSGKKSKASSNTAYQFTSGTNGVGVTVVNALAKELTCIVRRDGKEATLRFENGKAVEEYSKPYKGKDTGTYIEFTPMEFLDGREVLGELDLDPQEVYKLVRDLGYLTPKGTLTELELVDRDGKIKVFSFKNESGVLDLLPYYINPKRNLISTSVFTDYHEEEIHTNGADKLMDAMTYEVALTYNLDHDSMYKSFANYCDTYDGGSHVKAIEDAVSYVIMKKAKDSMTDAEKKRIDIKPQDTRNGLSVVMHAQCKFTDKSFEGQTKEKFVNERVYRFIKSSMIKKLFKLFDVDKKTGDTLIKLTKDMAKARLNAQKEKDVVLKGAVNNFFKDDTGKLVRAEGNGYKEIIVVEGDSAGGSLKNMRDNLRQAIYPLKGVPLNAFTKTFNEAMTNDELRAFCNALGCGGGKSFKIENLKYDKIIIMTDADADGGKIRSLLSAFFIRHMPQLIIQGKVFVSSPPLYGWKEKNGNMRYFLDNFDYVDYLIKASSNQNTVSIGEEILTTYNLESLLLRNKNYISILDEIANQLVIHPEILEYVVYYLDRSYKEFVKVLTKKFPYLEVERSITKDSTGVETTVVMVSGLFREQFYTVVLNTYTISKLDRLRHLIEKDNFGNIFVELNGTVVTMYNMLMEFQKYAPRDLQRYKGLGEMDADQLWDTTTNPANRKLYKLTAKDVEYEIAKFDILHGKDADSRKELLALTDIDADMIDN
ncbi:MAG: toprim domain-containing protein [Fusobacteriaceae bacterium]